jgi:hypothetical protein
MTYTPHTTYNPHRDSPENFPKFKADLRRCFVVLLWQRHPQGQLPIVTNSIGQGFVQIPAYVLGSVL